MNLSPITRQHTPNDVGTMWIMRQRDHVARCAIMAWPGDWELRVVVNGCTLLAERCPRGAEAFAVADEWKRRMVHEGWNQVIPDSATHPTRRVSPATSGRPRRQPSR
jgi:hypothetical protein